MNEKDSKSTKAYNRETSRRGFLKTGAAAAGAALLGEAFNLSFASAAEKTRQDLKDVQLLFVQNAKDVSLKNGRLTLIGVSLTTIFFSDRPRRIAGHMHTEDFVLEWQKGTGKESFHTDPPNGTLSIFAEDDIVDIVLELKNPRLAGGALVYENRYHPDRFRCSSIPSEDPCRPGQLPGCIDVKGGGSGDTWCGDDVLNL